MGLDATQKWTFFYHISALDPRWMLDGSKNIEFDIPFSASNNI